MYDYLVVGSGLFGSIFAREMTQTGHKVLIVDKRKQCGGNVYTNSEKTHLFGPHLFHTKNEKIWRYITQFSTFNHYQHRVKAIYDGKMYSLPFNMNTFNQLWGCITPKDAKRELEKRLVKIDNPQSIEELALATVGEEIYHKLIYGYTKKQWQRHPKDLPATILSRIPIRFTYDDNYFDDPFQGVPHNGYSDLIQNIIGDIDVKLETDFFDLNWKNIANKLVFSGPIDRYYNYEFGELEYRSLEFKHETHPGNYQGIGQLNHTNESTPFTRSVEHNHFYFENKESSTITFEYPTEWDKNKEPYYPINDMKNNEVYAKYRSKAKQEIDVIFGGRLGNYKYWDMDQTAANALALAKKELK